MVRFTIRPSIRVGDIADKEVTAPAYLLSPEQAISFGYRLIEAGETMQREARDAARAARRTER